MRTSSARAIDVLTATEAALLGLLALRGEQSGYDLKKAVDDSVGYFWRPAKTQIYTVLPRLVEAGYATRQAVEQTDRPDKYVYRLTPAGREAVSGWVEAPPSEDDRAPFLLRVYLGGLGSPETLAQHVRAQREEAESLKADLEEIDARVEGSRGSYHAALTRRYGLAYAHAVIEWAEAVEQELSA